MAEIKLKNGARLELHIAIGRDRFEKKWKNKTVTWTELLERISETVRTHETAAEYRNMGKDGQSQIKDIGGFVGGVLKNGRRRNGYVQSRSLITLDADFAPTDFWDDVELMTTYAVAAYSTHKHTPEHPRLRFIIPMSRDVTPEEYEAIARFVANELGIDYFDDTTYEPTRLMYWPSTSKDAEFFFEYVDAPILDPDAILSKYTDWRDTSNWPESSRCKGLRKKAAEKQGDPLAKTGLIGAFCRTYTIEDAIATFLPDVYTECNTPGRYTYANGSTAAGLVIYEDKFAYSNHATDPASGQLCNAFDLVRIHLFGEEDLDAKDGTPVNKLPSWGKMMELVGADENVKLTIGEEKIQKAKAEFGDGFKDSEDAEWMKKLKTNKAGGYEPTIANLKLILQNDPNLQAIHGRDLFRDRCTVKGELPWPRDGAMWTDVDDAGLRDYMESVYGIEAKGKLLDALALVFEERSFHPVKQFIESTAWDGRARVERLLIDYLGAEDCAYVRAVTRKTIIAAIARIYDPGCKFDHMLTIVGKQGIGKTLIVQRLAGEWFSNSITEIRGKESYEALDGAWIVEMGELAALKKSDRDAIKNYISKTEDTYRKAYARNVTINRRHSIFIGTTNESSFLEDDTGNRRFWVVDTNAERRTKTVWGVNGMTAEEVHQVWAEALELYRAGENIMELTDEEAAAAQREQEKHTSEDSRQGIIERYLSIPLPADWASKSTFERMQYYSSVETFKGSPNGVERTKVCAIEVWTECFQQPEARMLKSDTRQINAMLEKLGWIKSDKLMRFGPYGVQRGFIKPKTED